VGAVLVLISGSTDNRSGVSAALSAQPLIFVGNVSYGWYLWHWPILALSKILNPETSPAYTTLALLVSFLLTYLSYQLIESPVRKSVYFLSRPRIFVSVAGLAMAVVVFSQIALLDRAQSSIGSPVLNKLNAARYDLPEVYSLGCDDWPRSSVIERCEFGAKTAVQEVMLI
jgi:hypothetical protein